MIKNNNLMIIFVLCSFLNIYLAHADTIELKDNRVFKVNSYWEKDGKVFYQKHGTVVSFEKSQIKKIVDEDGPVSTVVYRDEGEHKTNDLMQSKTKEYTSKKAEEVIEGLLVENKDNFPPNHDFEHNGTRYKYISPGVYRAENGTIYKTTRVSAVKGEPFPPNHDFEHNGTRYKYISPGVYQTENGTTYKTAQRSFLEKENQSSITKDGQKSKATGLQNNSIPRDFYGRPMYNSYDRPLNDYTSKSSDPNPCRKIYKGMRFNEVHTRTACDDR